MQKFIEPKAKEQTNSCSRLPVCSGWDGNGVWCAWLSHPEFRESGNQGTGHV